MHIIRAVYITVYANFLWLRNAKMKYLQYKFKTSKLKEIFIVN